MPGTFCTTNDMEKPNAIVRSSRMRPFTFTLADLFIYTPSEEGSVLI